MPGSRTDSWLRLFSGSARTKWLNTKMNLHLKPQQAWERTATTIGIARKIYRPALRRQTADSWAALVHGELVVRTVPGDHDHMLDERYAPGLAEYIQSVTSR